MEGFYKSDTKINFINRYFKYTGFLILFCYARLILIKKN